MATNQTAARAERTLRFCMRAVATVTLLAAIFVAAPYAWMNSVHSSLGLGVLPEEPIVGYLARSTSALYTLLAGLVWVISFDLRRHYHVLLYLTWAVMILGVALFAVDIFEGLPASWTYSEGPMLIAFGLVSLHLIRKSKLSRSNAEALARSF